MKYLVKILVNAIAVYLTCYLLGKGVHLNSVVNALLVALVLSILNATLKPVLILFTIPATIFTLGLFLLVINAAIIMVASYLLKPDFVVDSFWWALGFSIILSFINSVLEGMILQNENGNGK